MSCVKQFGQKGGETMKKLFVLILALIFPFALMSVGFTATKPAGKEAPKAVGDAAKGKALFLKNCAECHGDSGEGRKKEEAPAVGNSEFLVVASDQFLMNAILKGRANTKMKGLEGKGTEADAKDVIAFLRTFQKEPSLKLDEKPLAGGNPTRGATLFEANCTQCHGEKGEGKKGPALNNKGFLADAPDMYLYKTITQGRKGTPMDPMLKEKGGKLSQRDVLDLISFIRQWGNYAGENGKTKD